MVIICIGKVLSSYPKNLAWNGGPLHLQYEHGSEVLTKSKQHIKENVIAIKVISYMDEIYIITPRYLLHNVLLL